MNADSISKNQDFNDTNVWQKYDFVCQITLISMQQFEPLPTAEFKNIEF